MARTKIMPRKGGQKDSDDQDQSTDALRAAPSTSGPLLEEATPPMQSDLPTPSELERRVEEVERLGEVGGHWGHCQPDSWPRWPQRLGHLCLEGGASSQEVLTYHGRQGHEEGILVGCTSEETPKVLTGNCCSLPDQPFSKEHRAPHLENALLMACP